MERNWSLVWKEIFTQSIFKSPNNNNITGKEVVTDNDFIFKLILGNEIFDSEITKINKTMRCNSKKKLFNYSCTNKIDDSIKPYYICPFSDSTINLLMNSKVRKLNILKKERFVSKLHDIRNDFFSQLIDWSITGILAIANKKDIYFYKINLKNIFKFKSCIFDINNIKFNDNGDFLIVSTYNGIIQIFQVETGACLYSKNLHVGIFSNFRCIGTFLSVGKHTGEIVNKDLRAMDKIVSVWKGHESFVCGLDWNHNYEYLISGCCSGVVNVWSQRKNAPICMYKEHSSTVKGISWSPSNVNLFATGGGAKCGKICINDILSGETIKVEKTNSQVNSLLWLKNADCIVTSNGEPKNSLNFWDSSNLTNIESFGGFKGRPLNLVSYRLILYLFLGFITNGRLYGFNIV
uniref:WD_REPEATS_REGION domain-containing protein n=1 Tax=Parastrongyloides trichosuri TaxID=131310 RepID=A0A0N4Z9D6_PARTI